MIIASVLLVKKQCLVNLPMIKWIWIQQSDFKSCFSNFLFNYCLQLHCALSNFMPDSSSVYLCISGQGLKKIPLNSCLCIRLYFGCCYRVWLSQLVGKDINFRIFELCFLLWRRDNCLANLYITLIILLKFLLYHKIKLFI